MTCIVQTSDDGSIISFSCGPSKPKDHECDFTGEMVELEDGLISATCSQCGRPAFNIWDAYS